MHMKLRSLESSSFSYLPPVGILEGHTMAFILPLQASPGRVLAEVYIYDVPCCVLGLV